MHTIEVLNSDGKTWNLWQDAVATSRLAQVLYAALQTFDKARVNGRVVYRREG